MSGEAATSFEIGIVGAGVMGSGIAQVAATAGHPVRLHDAETAAIEEARERLATVHARLVEKGRLARGEANEILARIAPAEELSRLSDARVVIEAIVEDLDAKRALFAALDDIVAPETILATNTSSLSVTAIASAGRDPGRVVGMHFFNPPARLPLVEIVPGLLTGDQTVARARALASSWGKTPVTARDTPGFIVNRVARPFYGESLRILEERIAGIVKIDGALRAAGFPMGPFELMDLVGTDVSLSVTESLFRQTGEPRHRPAVTQRRLVDAGLLGRKSGRGYYTYGADGSPGAPLDLGSGGSDDEAQVVERVVSMLVNEACDAVLFGIASAADIDLAVTKGLRYPKGLLAWGDEIGPAVVLAGIEALGSVYGEERYRASALLRRAVAKGTSLSGG